tara:strand:- start:205 stop:330 length:126 start_codon:yes stop_codon:yes gene_type:complete
MLKLLIKNKKMWLPALIIIFLIVFMIILSKYGFNPLGYVVY